MHKGRGLNLTDEVNEYINKAKEFWGILFPLVAARPKLFKTITPHPPTDSKKMKLSHKK